MAYDMEAKPQRSRSKLTDDDFLNLVQNERNQSVGFDHDQELTAAREQGLNYYKGVMPDMPALDNRSSAVSTDVADAIETVLPDMMEIFTGGDDVVTFRPAAEADEDAAEQETEFVNQVVFQENDGFLVLYSMFKDAFQSKIGVVKFWWEANPIAPEDFHGKTDLEVVLMKADGEIEDIEIDGTDPETGEPTYAFTLTREQPGGSVCIEAVPPEDFTVAADTVVLEKATYCAFRSRPRRQDLIEQGIDQALVEDLPAYGTLNNDTLRLARDTAGEHTERQTLTGTHNLDTVEVIEHFIRVDADEDGTPELWRILTGGGETVLIEKEQIDRLPFAAITPRIVAHRFYGESIADILIPIQRIKTALLRMFLDSGYFALNQRMTVVDSLAGPYTITDLLRNEPGLPIRTKAAGAVEPIQSPGLGFLPLDALEYVSTMGEQRTGIVRNAQGLNPDTLHDTAGGMEKLMVAAQMRMRLIARIFAETGVKDLFLGVHALLRKHGHIATAKVGGKWTPVDCSQWAERSQMDVSIGLGSAGRVQEIGALQAIIGHQAEIVKAQGGINGPLVSAENIYKAVTRFALKAGEKMGDQYFTDPAQAGPQPAQAPPGAAEAQMKGQIEQARLAQQDKEHTSKITLDAMVEHDKDDRERLELQQKHVADMEKIASAERIAMLESETKRADVDARLQLEQQKLQTNIQIALIQAQGQQTDTETRAQAEAARMSVDIELQEHQHAHDAEQARMDRKAQDALAEKSEPESDD